MFEESKVSIDERLERLEKQVKELKADKDEEIKEIFFQEIRFDPKLYKDGESKVNLLLKMENVHIFKQFLIICNSHSAFSCSDTFNWMKTKNTNITIGTTTNILI